MSDNAIVTAEKFFLASVCFESNIIKFEYQREDNAVSLLNMQCQIHVNACNPSNSAIQGQCDSVNKSHLHTTDKNAGCGIIGHVMEGYNYLVR